MRRPFQAIVVCMLTCCGATLLSCQRTPSEDKPDPAGATALLTPQAHSEELAQGPGRELVKTHCTVCHSARLITQQRASRDGWRTMIRWMQAKQNLWELPADVETSILDYLAKHYGNDARGPLGFSRRRAPLPPHAMPPPH